MDWDSWVAPVQQLALEAGAVILGERARGLTVTVKPDGSPQCNADCAADAFIMLGLQNLDPLIPVITEESAPSVMPSLDKPFWLVDPLDGTRSFLAGHDDYSINIALIIQQRPAFGLIYAPSRQEMFWNDGDGAAWYSSPASAPAARLAARPVPQQGMTMITGRRTMTGLRLQGWLDNNSVAQHLMVSSALKFGYIAQGKADVYPRFGETMEWDNAAGEAILVAAGGGVATLDGYPLPYGQADLMHRGFIAYGRKS